MTNHLDTTHAQPARWDDLDLDGRIIAVRALAALNLTGSEIAGQLGTTKGAVLGVCFRKKIPLTARPARRPPTFPTEPAVPESTWAPLGPPVSILDATPDQCAWPVGADTDRTCCGAPRVKGSYCEHHYAMGHAPRKGDYRYTEELKRMKLVGGREPEITVDEALAVVRPGQKRKEGME